MGIYCVLWVVIQCYFSFVAQTVPVLVTGSSFNWLPCPFDIWHTPITVCVCVCVCVCVRGKVCFLPPWRLLMSVIRCGWDSEWSHPAFSLASATCYYASDYERPRSSWTNWTWDLPFPASPVIALQKQCPFPWLSLSASFGPRKAWWP